MRKKAAFFREGNEANLIKADFGKALAVVADREL